MLFTPYQIIIILRTILSGDEITASGGPVPEVQRRILKNPDYNVKNLGALMAILLDHKLLPYDKSWQYPITQLYGLHKTGEVIQIEREFTALYKMAQVVIEAGTASVEPTMRQGALFFSALYLMAFVDSKHSAHARFRTQAFDTACRYFQTLINELENDKSLCALLIKGKAAANIVVTRWNYCAPADRNGREMRQYIRRSAYLRWAVQQIKMFPRDDKPAFNLLGMASRFRRRRFYPFLLAALRVAKSDFETKSAYLYDDDFEDFRKWLAEQTRPSPADLDPEKHTADLDPEEHT